MDDLVYTSLVFDQEFYNHYYGCKSTVDDFIKDYINQGRYTHRCITEDNFNYALFISKLNWDGIYLSSPAQAISYYLEHKSQYSSWFTKQNPKESIAKNTTAIYYANVNSDATTDIAQKSIKNLFPYIQSPKIIISGKPKYISYIKSLFGSDAVIELDTLSDWSEVKNHIQKFSKCLYLNNKLYLYKNIDYLINNYANNSIISLIDKYNTIYYTIDSIQHKMIPRLFYTINSNFFIFDRSIFNDIINILQSTKECLGHEYKLNYDITSYCRNNNLPIDFFYQQEIEKEAFWHNLFEMDLLNHQALVTKHDIPVINIEGITSYNNIDCLLMPKNTEQNFNIACHIHIGNTSPAYIMDIKQTIETIKNNHSRVDFFITSNDTITDLSTIIVPNKGADIGPFLYILNSYILNNLKYKYILKFHTKTHHGFRKLAYDTLIAKLATNLNILENNDQVCMAGVKCHEMNIESKDINIGLINQFCTKYNIPYNESSFYAGTMFLAKTSMFRSFVDKYHIDLMQEYEDLEQGYKQNHHATYTHTWERIISGIIPSVVHQSKLSL